MRMSKRRNQLHIVLRILLLSSLFFSFLLAWDTIFLIGSLALPLPHLTTLGTNENISSFMSRYVCICERRKKRTSERSLRRHKLAPLWFSLIGREKKEKNIVATLSISIGKIIPQRAKNPADQPFFVGQLMRFANLRKLFDHERDEKIFDHFRREEPEENLPQCSTDRHGDKFVGRRRVFDRRGQNETKSSGERLEIFLVGEE